jgi:hypothetical protein
VAAAKPLIWGQALWAVALHLDVHYIVYLIASQHQMINPGMRAVNTEISLNSVNTALIVAFSVFLFCAILRYEITV